MAEERDRLREIQRGRFPVSCTVRYKVSLRVNRDAAAAAAAATQHEAARDLHYQRKPRQL